MPIVAALIGIIAIWYAVSYLLLSESRRFLLPPPHQVLAETIGNDKVIGLMIAALGQTITVALIGLAIAVRSAWGGRSSCRSGPSPRRSSTRTPSSCRRSRSSRSRR
jgi:Na+-transporting NADH:ubiquinone oxidoreductase subunit NqrF